MSKKPVRKLFVAILVIILSLSHVDYAYATSTKDRLDQAERERDETQQEKDAAEETHSALIGEQTTLQGTLNALNQELAIVGENLEVIEGDIAVKELEIETTRAELAAAENTRDEQDVSMQKRIQFMYESSSTTYLDMLFSAKSFGDLINAATYINSIAEYDRNMLEKYQQTVALIEEKEALLNTEMAELATLKADAESQKSEVMALVGQTSVSIAQYADEIAAIEEDIAGYEEEIAQQNADIEALQELLRQEQAQSQLAASSAWRDISEITFDEGDRKLLANLIYCEARGESYEGKVAVGSVVINRVLSSVFPNTVVGVIYAPNQFAPVTSTKNSLALALAEDKAANYPDCYKAADEAMSGYSNVGNRVYFRTPIPGLEGLQIGNHIFY